MDNHFNTHSVCLVPCTAPLLVADHVNTGFYYLIYISRANHKNFSQSHSVSHVRMFLNKTQGTLD